MTSFLFLRYPSTFLCCDLLQAVAAVEKVEDQSNKD